MVRPFKPEAVMAGLALIALGVLWTAANLGSVDDMLGMLRRWWPATLVVWGLLELAAAYSDGRARRS
jgi:hypothetical protein